MIESITLLELKNLGIESKKSFEKTFQDINTKIRQVNTNSKSFEKVEETFFHRLFQKIPEKDLEVGYNRGNKLLALNLGCELQVFILRQEVQYRIKYNYQHGIRKFYLMHNDIPNHDVAKKALLKYCEKPIFELVELLLQRNKLIKAVPYNICLQSPKNAYKMYNIEELPDSWEYCGLTIHTNTKEYRASTRFNEIELINKGNLLVGKQNFKVLKDIESYQKFESSINDLLKLDELIHKTLQSEDVAKEFVASFF